MATHSKSKLWQNVVNLDLILIQIEFDKLTAAQCNPWRF